MYDSYEGDYTYDGEEGLWTLGLAWERVTSLYRRLDRSYFVVTPNPHDVHTTSGTTMGAYGGTARRH